MERDTIEDEAKIITTSFLDFAWSNIESLKACKEIQQNIYEFQVNLNIRYCNV